MPFCCLKYFNTSFLPKRLSSWLLNSANMVLQNTVSKHFPRVISRYPTHLFQIRQFIHYPSYVSICIFVVAFLMFFFLPSPKSCFLLSICSKPSQTFTFFKNISLIRSSQYLSFSVCFPPMNFSSIVCYAFWNSPEMDSIFTYFLICGNSYPQLDSRFLVSRK